MIDASELIDKLVSVLRDIPDLITEMGGDPSRIYAYHDNYPENASLARAIHQMPVPGIMAVWQGTAPGNFGAIDVWKHQVMLYLRAGEAQGGSSGYNRLFRLLTKGIPSSAAVPMLNVTVHPSCHPMDLPLIQRQTDAEGLDYFEAPLTFTEIGDE